MESIIVVAKALRLLALEQGPNVDGIAISDIDPKIGLANNSPKIGQVILRETVMLRAFDKASR